MKDVFTKQHFAALLLGLSLHSFAWANDDAQTHALKDIPTEEGAFVDSIPHYTKAQIIALLGEPARADDVKLKDSGRVVASIWYYHNLNTDIDGKYYETTELDFVEDKVTVIAFLNNDGTEKEDGKTYKLDPAPQEEPLPEIK